MTKEQHEEIIIQDELASAEIIEVPITQPAVAEAPEAGEGMLDLDDVAYMVIAGRTKEGETFFRSVGINDLIVIRGLVEYALDEVKYTTNKHFENK